MSFRLLSQSGLGGSERPGKIEQDFVDMPVGALLTDPNGVKKKTGKPGFKLIPVSKTAQNPWVSGHVKEFLVGYFRPVLSDIPGGGGGAKTQPQ